tara:strand:+ start:448 stop:954 length:507 start_codon:yes stop_codon:yes gene_type:complete
MSAITDKLKSTIKKVLEAPKVEISSKINNIVKNIRLGKNQEKEMQKILKSIETTENAVNTVKDGIKTIKSIQQSLEAAKTAAEVTEKASTISSALNPAAAAVAVAQKYIIEGLKKEVQEVKDALNVSPALIDNFENFIIKSKDKLKQMSEEYKNKKRLKQERRNKLTS